MSRGLVYTEAEYMALLARMGRTPEPLSVQTPEATLLARVRQYARANGWLFHHVRDSRGCDPGFPDTCLTDGSSVLFMELKSNTGKPTPEQARWLSLLEHTGQVECGIWRPRDFATIVERLTRK